MNILNLSSTPLVGSPYNLNKALKLFGYNAHLVYISEYPKIKNFFPKPDFYFQELIEKKQYYDLAICHNICDINVIQKVFDISKKKILILHSTIYDGPIYHRFYLENVKDKFDKVFSLSQGHGRFYPKTKPYTNIIFQNDFNQDFDITNKINICSTFTLSSRGRFGSKNPDSAIKYLGKFFKENSDKFNYMEISKIRQTDVRKLRSIMHFNIDDMYTGAFHQVSLEAIASGGLAINGADKFALLNFQNAIKVNEKLPFIICQNVESCIERISEFFFNKKKLIDSINYSRNFYFEYLKPKRLTNIFLSHVYND